MKVERSKLEIWANITSIIIIIFFWVSVIFNPNHILSMTSYFMYIYLTLFLSISVYKTLKYHEIEVSSGILSFDKTWFKRTRIPIEEIKQIIEVKQEIRGIISTIYIPSFTIVCNNDILYKYYSGIRKENERLELIRNLFSSIKPIEYL